MITTEEEYVCTRERVAARGTPRIMLAGMRRELAMWEAGIRELVPGVVSPIDPPDVPDGRGVLTDEARRAASRQAEIAFKRGEIANIDRQIGIVLDRIADWRRHRTWLEREIAELAAADHQPVGASA